MPSKIGIPRKRRSTKKTASADVEAVAGFMSKHEHMKANEVTVSRLTQRNGRVDVHGCRAWV
jgi:hypothetical protein